MQKNLNVLFLIAKENKASSRIRVTNLLPLLSQYGIQAEQLIYPRKLKGKLQLLQACKNYDVVVLQKRLLPRAEFQLLRWMSRTLLYDFDDAVYLRNTNTASYNGQDWHSPTRSKRFKYMVKRVDRVIAGNQYLADYTKSFQNNVAIIPSAVPTSNIAQKTNYDNVIPIIGWIGGRDTLKYLEMIKQPLIELAQLHQFKLHIISDGTFQIPGIECQNIPWSLETQELETSKFDIGIMPLQDDPWARGKCSYKLLQYMAASVPFVASDVGMNGEVANNNTTGYTVSEMKEFGEKLAQLLEDGELRASMGRYGRTLVEERYSIETVAKLLADTLKKNKHST